MGKKGKFFQLFFQSFSAVGRERRKEFDLIEKCLKVERCQNNEGFFISVKRVMQWAIENYENPTELPTTPCEGFNPLEWCGEGEKKRKENDEEQEISERELEWINSNLIEEEEEKEEEEEGEKDRRKKKRKLEGELEEEWQDAPPTPPLFIALNLWKKSVKWWGLVEEDC